MDSIERLVRTWMASGRDQEIAQIVLEISSERTTLLKAVKALGEYLTSEESQSRSKGVELLSLILERLPPEALNRQSARTLSAFYCDKLNDPEAIVAALQGLQALVALPAFGPTEATSVMESIIQNVKAKTLTQANRLRVYNIIDSLMANHRNSLKSLGLRFLDGYISLVDGEKDPRNLLVVFAIDRVILIEFDISERVQPLHDVVFCYFPISFRPPPNNPGGITSDDLRIALRSCLAATPMFGILGIPHFLENLVSGSRAAKKDTLETLIVCLPVYGATVAQSFARKLWNSLKLEVFQPVDPATEELALIAIQTLLRTIYSGEGEQDSDQNIQGLARDACEECVQILREPEKSQAKPATRILCSFMTTTTFVSRYTISQVVPHLTKLFINPDEATSRPATLILLAQFIEAARDSMDGDDASSSIPLLPYKDEVLGVLSGGLKNHSLRLPALTGLKGLVTTSKLLSDQELGFIVHSVNEIIQGDPDQFNEVREGILELLQSISKVSPAPVAEQTLPLLFASLPDSAPPREAGKERAQCWKTLSALQVLCVEPELFETLVVRLTTKLELLLFPPNPPTDAEPSAAYAHAILKTLLDTLAVKLDKRHTDIAKYIDRLASRLFNIFIYSASFSSPEGPMPMIGTDHRLLQVAAQCINLVVRSLPLERQRRYMKSIFRALLQGDITDISEGYFKITLKDPLTIFNAAAPTMQRDLLVLFSGAITPLYKEVELEVSNLGHLLNNILHWILDAAQNELQRNSAIHIISILVNRKAEELSEFLQSLEDEFWDREIVNVERDLSTRRWAIVVWAWISKALLLRNHPLSAQLSERLFEIFSDSTISWDAARAIGTIPSQDGLLTKRNHAVVKILYAQKYVNNMLPRTIAGAKDSSNPTQQTAYLVALSSLIKSTPKPTYSGEIPALIPLLIRGLDLPDADIRNNVLETLLAAAAGETPEKGLVAEHSSTLVTAMLKNCMFSEMPSPVVRISALRYLGTLPSIVRYDILHPYKSQVLRELGKALDDPKRSVRKEAVITRTNWQVLQSVLHPIS